jgi:hypothetical protein
MGKEISQFSATQPLIDSVYLDAPGITIEESIAGQGLGQPVQF